MAKKSYLELAHEDDIKKNTGKDRDKVTYKDLAALDDQETYGKVYNDAIRKLSNSAIWREPKELSDLRKRADTAAYGQSGGLGKFFSDVRDMSDERAKYYAQFGSKDKFVGAQIDNMDKRQVREPSAPVGEADILPKNTNDYLRFQSEQMMGAGPRTIGTNPIAEMMEKQKFFQQTAHDPQALQFAKFTGEYDQMGRDDRLNFENATIDVERDKLNEDNKSLESEYYNQYAKLYGDNMYFDDYEAEGKKLNELSDKRAVYSDRLSMLDSMQGQVGSAQRWNATKDKYAPYMSAPDFAQSSVYDASKIKGSKPKDYASQINDPDYTYNYINNPELWEAKTGNNQIFQYENAHLQYLTDEERGIYNYLYKNQGAEAASKMLDDMAEQLRARRSYGQEKATAQYAKDNPVGSFFEARGRNLQKAVIGPAQIAATLMGKGADDPIFDINRVSESIDAINAQELSKAFGGVKIPFLDADAGEVVYGILSSGADAAAAMGIGKLLLGSNAAVQGIMSSGAASSATKSALERGMEPWKAATMGALSGLIEAVTEKYSIEALFSPVDKKAWRFFLKNVFTEGSEELASSALNRITDGLLNADKSEIAQRAQEIARLNGIPLEQAKKQARTEWLKQAGVEFISGAVMGGVFAAPKALVSSVKNKSNPTPPSTAEQIAKKEAEIAQKEAEAYERATRERMDFETRDSEASKKYAELVKLVNESFPEDSETKAKIAEAVTIDTKRMTEIATNAMQELRARMQAEPTPETLKLSETLTQTVEGIFAGMQTDRAAITDKYTAGLDEAVKSEIKGKNDVTYAKGYGIAHALGAIGVPLDTIAKVKSVSTLQETAKQAAEQGQAKWEAALPHLKTKAADLQKALPKPGQGGVTYRANVKQEALSTLQRDQIWLLEKIAKPLGYNFVMMEFDKDAQGNYVTDKGQVAPNGYFRDTDGTIYIDVNAGKTAGRMVDDTIIPLTAGHELGHYLKATSPELFRAYSAAVVEELVSKGTDIDALIAKQIGRGKLREITVESALEEMIMESGAMILSNSQAAQKMAETNPGLFQKIAEWVKDFVDSIRKAFSRVDATPEAKAIMQTVNGALKYSDTIINLWDTMALKEAQGRADVKPAVVARRDVQAVAKEAAGKKTAYTSDGQAVDYHYEVVPVGNLIPSNLETSLEPNPDYPQELQPRDRTRAASQQQVEEIANKLNPALLGESADVGTGAPFIGPDMVVESGNGRVLAITRAMRQGKGLTYTQWLKDNAGRFGLDPAKIDNASVLVRVRDTEVNRPEFVQKANESQVATYSDSESAVSDAKKVTPAMLEMANMDSGDINSAGNSSFVASFISKVVPVAERGRMMDASGKLSKSGENRVRTALFQMAYEDGYLTEQMAEASDDTSKNILKAMTAVAPRLALMNDAMKKGTLSDYPIGQAIAEAYRIVQRQKRLGVSVDRYINQQSLVRQDTPAHWMLLEMFNENRNAPNRMTDALNSILNAAERQGNPNQMLMPGLEAERPSVEGIVREGLNRYGEEQMDASERYQERDASYLSAVESGDMDTAQKMVDEAAKAAGYTIKAYHGTEAQFNAFDKNTIADGTGYGRKNVVGGLGFYFTNDQAMAKSYANGPAAKNPRTISAYLKIDNPLEVKDEGWGSAINQVDRRESELRRWAKEGGHDGIIVESTDEILVDEKGNEFIDVVYVVFSPDQIKLSDPVTYDDAGNPIPLSQRFTDSNDIRYQERESVPKPKLSSKQITEILQEIDVARPRDVKQSNYLKNGIISRLREKGITHIDAYHVTDATGASLQEKGLLGSELDYVGRTSGNLRESSVYVFLDPDDIELGYGGITGISESTNNVVHLLIPINKIIDMYPDYNFGASFDTYSAVRFVGDMPSSYIDGVYKINKPSGGIGYQERDPDYRTKRDILAGAFDSVAQTESEKSNLKEYKNLIGALNRMEEEARGLRQANTAERKKPDRDKAVIEKNTKRIAEIEDRINNLDKRLLKMQNAAPLQNVLKREVDYYKKQQNMINRQQLEKYRADRAETSIKQRHRADITKGVKSLNTMLMNESDQKHIPEGFKGAVLDFLRLFTDDTSVFDYKRLSVLKEMYDALETSDSELAGMYDFDIAQDIADAARMLEGKRLSQLTEAELESLRDIVTHFNHIVKNENQIFTQKRSVKTTDAAEEGLSEYGKKAKEMRLALLNGKNPVAAINKFLTSKNIKPMYFFKRVGGILQELFDDVRAAQGKWAFRMAEDRNFFRDTVNKYNYYKWVDDGQLTFTTARGDQITLTRDQALELYAINKREKTNKQQGAEHLAIGGFVYNDAVKVKKKSALGVPMTYEVNVGENHPLTDSDLEQISKWLTGEQRAFADEMVNYLSTVMGERGNEVSMALYGLRKYKEKYYFPYKSASNYLYSHQGGAQDDSAIKHRSFTKKTTVSANNPVVLTGFTKVWADHVQNMNLYNAMAVPLDNFNRVYNYRIRGDKDATKAQSVKAALEAAYGKEANAYIKQLLNDVNGGIRPDKGDAEARKLMSLWKKGAVFASLSVVVQQPSAIGRALALVDPKYFRKGYTKAGYDEMMKWSGTANIKAMGRFDANMGMTAADWLTQREYTGMDEKAKAFAKDGSFRDDVLSWLPQKADEMTWTALWEAVKRETASKHGNLIGSDAFMQKVAERFDEVVDYTQVYDSVLSRSEVMRSQSALAQMVTSFMAEPTTAYNMLLDSIANRKNKGMKNYVKPGRALGAFAVSVMLNSILKAMVTAGRDDDEKYTYLEKYLRKVSGSIADELNPLGLVPYGRDILSLWDGYDVERTDMSLIGDLINAAKKASKTDTPILQRMDVLAGAIGNALGIPYKNVRRDIQGVYNVLANTAPMSRQSVSGAKYSILEGLPWFDASKAGYARRLYSAITKGDAQEEAGLREQISKIVKKDTDINTELRKVISTEFEEERLEPRIALQQMIDLTALKEIKGKIGDWYKTGLITEDVAEQLLVEFTADDQPNERYKTIESWNFSKNPENEGESYSTYKPFYEAIDSGKNLRAVVNEYMDPKKYGASKSTLSSRITDTYKDQYIETYKRSKTEAASLKSRLLNAYVMLGYDRNDKSKDIDAWLKQK